MVSGRVAPVHHHVQVVAADVHEGIEWRRERAREGQEQDGDRSDGQIRAPAEWDAGRTAGPRSLFQLATSMFGTRPPDVGRPAHLFSSRPPALPRESMHAFLLLLSAATLAQVPAPRAHERDVARWAREARAVTITRDDWGIPHVRGKTDADAVFGMIYAQAEDDFNRVETNYLAVDRPAGRGRGGERDLAGPPDEAVHRSRTACGRSTPRARPGSSG